MIKLVLILLAGLLLGSAMAAPAAAVDTLQTRDAPDLAAVRAKIKTRDWKSAIADLNVMIDKGQQHADIYNLLAFSLRNDGDVKTAQTYYQKALDFDPDHKGALEYQGELFVKIGDIAKARANAEHLTKLCPQGCEELEDLQKAIATSLASAK